MAVLPLTPADYCYNSDHLTGVSQVKIRQLELVGYRVVQVTEKSPFCSLSKSPASFSQFDHLQYLKLSFMLKNVKYNVTIPTCYEVPYI